MGQGGFLFSDEAYTTKGDNTVLSRIEVSSLYRRACLDREDSLARKVTELADCWHRFFWLAIGFPKLQSSNHLLGGVKSPARWDNIVLAQPSFPFVTHLLDLR
jgi:hypothetical protein